FQAEDGIRDFHVTGVQTCALPIYGVPRKFTTKLKHVVELNFTFDFHHQDSKPLIAATLKRIADTTYAVGGVPAFTIQRHLGPARSEERRVGKEGRARRSAEQ